MIWNTEAGSVGSLVYPSLPVRLSTVRVRVRVRVRVHVHVRVRVRVGARLYVGARECVCVGARECVSMCVCVWM